MAASFLAAAPAHLPSLSPCSKSQSFEPDTAAIERRLRRGGVEPTPKILHALRKKETQKALRRSKKRALESPPLTEPQRQALEEDSHFRAVSAEYRAVRAELDRSGATPRPAGRPWEGTRGVDLRLLAREGDGGGRLKGEFLEDLSGILAERSGERLRWLLDDDVEVGGGAGVERRKKPVPITQMTGDDGQKIKLLVKRLSSTKLDMHDWQFSRLMKQSGLFFTEIHLLKIVEGLGALGNWRHALSVVEWVYNEKVYKHRKSRFVYTKLLAVLGKGRRPCEALHIFNTMREDAQIYPDMAAYHAIAVALGQAGLVKELVGIVECMRQKPSKRLKNMKFRNWDPCLEPDIIIYNAVLNACVPSHQWKGVSWVLGQMRLSGLKPNGATYGLAMEVMLHAGKYDLVYKYFEKMLKGGIAPKSLTYKALVRAYWKEGKVDEAVNAVRDMEQRGVVGTASVYYELACCLCNNGRWQDAMKEVEKLKRLRLSKPLEVTFTGMIMSSFDGGYFFDSISIFEHMKEHCTPNIGTINAMLKVYGRNDMFANARELFESTKSTVAGLNAHLDEGTSFKPDAYSYTSMLEASALAQQWDYFEYVYKEMALCGCQLDQKKYIWLLVEASRSGKGHLLEHAFDTILEAGEIPHVSLFTEMICQAIAQQDFERTIHLINSMAYASMQVSEDQWTNLFQRNKGRFGEDKLQNLLNHLANGGSLLTEDPIPTLLNSLRSLCGYKVSKNILTLVAPYDVSTDNLNFNESKNVVDTRGRMQTFLPSRASVNGVRCLRLSEDDPIFSVDKCDVSADNLNICESENVDSCGKMQAFPPSRASISDAGSLCPAKDDPIFSSNNTSTGSNAGGHLCGQVTGTASVVSKESMEVEAILRGCSNTCSTEEELDLLACHIEDSFSELPSASEILESWRENRIVDDTFRPSQPSQA